MNWMILFFGLIFNFLTLNGQNTIVQLPVTSAIIYEQGVTVEREGSVLLKSGLNKIEIGNLPIDLDESTLNIFAGNDVIIQSQKLFREYGDKKLANSKYLELKELIQDSITLLLTHITIFEGEANILNQNIDLSRSDSKFSAAEVSALRANYATEMRVIKESQLRLKNKIKKLNHKLENINKQIAEEGVKASRGFAILKLEMITASSLSSELLISYFMGNAGWTPTYDLRVNGLSNPLNIVYKANVYQNTGEDWNDVKVSLSTARPTYDYSLPQVEPYYLTFDNYYTYSRTKSYEDEAVMLEDVVVTGYAGAANGVTKRAELQQESNPLSIVKTQTSLNYDLENLLSIPSASQEQSILIRNEEVAAAFQYFGYPKIEQYAFLVAKVENWAALQILDGTANIYIDDRYVGQTEIAIEEEEDGIYLLSLGQDRAVQINRTLAKGFSKNKFIGNNRIETRNWDLEIINNKNETISIKIEDQFPVSKMGDIKVDLKEHSNAQINQNTGSLTWELSILPYSKKKFKFGYEVKYPKDRNMIVD